MAAIENEKIYGLKLRESANDGSDFPNPDADYRLAFLGEDGLWHIKDSAGAVSDPFSAGAAVATDPIWDAAGDLAVGTGANTAAKLAASATAGARVVSQGAAAALAYFLGTPVVGGGPASDLNTTSGTMVAITGMSVAFTAGPSGMALLLGAIILRCGAATFDCQINYSTDGGTTKIEAARVAFDGAVNRRPAILGALLTGLTPGAVTVTFYWSTTGGSQVFYDGASRGAVQLGTKLIVLPL